MSKLFGSEINTVNIILERYGEIQALRSFPDNKQGNKDAEKLFLEYFDAEFGLDNEDAQFAIEEGYYEDGGVKLTIIHDFYLE